MRTRWTRTTGLHWPSSLEFCPGRLRVFWHKATSSISRCAACFLKPKLNGMYYHAHPFSKSISQGASVDIQNLLSLHSQFLCLERKCHIHEFSLSFIWYFQFVTAVFVVSAKSRVCAASNDQLSCGGNAPQPVGALSVREKGARVQITITSRSLCRKMCSRQR